MNTNTRIWTKLSAARTRLILERPFIGSLLMHLRLAEAGAGRCATIATDARSLYFNPGYIAGLTLAETQFVLAHEALHCALAHFARRSHRTNKRWGVACDHAVNLILIQEGMRGPQGVLANAKFAGLTAEEIYPLIPVDTDEAPLDDHLFDRAAGPASGHDLGASGERSAVDPREAGRACTDGSPRTNLRGGDAADGADAGAGVDRAPMPDADDLPLGERLDPDSAEALAERWRTRLATAAQAAMQAGRLSDFLARSLEHLIQPRIPWRALLARYLLSVARDDYSFQRSSRRDGDALLPRLVNTEVNLVVAIDTSGSIGDEEMREFASEVDSLKGQIRASLTLHACDDALCGDGPWRFAPWESVRLPSALSGGGGTRFSPVFEWIEREQLRPDLLVYFTDAQGEFPPAPPPYPIVWLVKGRGDVPWGERIQLN